VAPFGGRRRRAFGGSVSLQPLVPIIASPARVAFDLTPTQNAHRNRGIGRYVKGLAIQLASQTEVPIEFWGWSYARPFEPPAPHRAVWLRRYGMPRSRAAWLFAKLAIRLFAQRSAARVVHVTDPNALVLLQGRQMLTTVYDLTPLLEPNSDRRFFEGRDYLHYLKRLQRVDRIFAISNQTAEDLRQHRGIPGSRIVLAPPGVDLVLTPRVTGGIAATPYFLYVGSPEPHKNVSALLQALTLAPDLPEQLVIAGTWYPKHLEQLHREADQVPGLGNRIRYRGFIPDAELGPLIASATALVVPSRREGFGLPVAEGLAAGGVVIHSRIPVLAEVSDGAALTFDPDSPAELAARLRQVSQDGDLRRELQQRGLRRSQALTWDRALADTLAVYREVLAAGGSGRH